MLAETKQGLAALAFRAQTDAQALTLALGLQASLAVMELEARCSYAPTNPDA